MTDSPTPQALKAAIDRGETGDKVAFPDQGSNPLGTDSEAGGTPYTQGEASTTRGLEAQIEAGKHTDPNRTRTWAVNPRGLPILLAVAAVAVMAAVLWWSLT